MSANDQAQRQARFLEAVRTALADYVKQRARDPTPGAGEVEFPSASLHADARPRFTMSLPYSLVEQDLGAAHLFYHDVVGRGFEFGLRRFLDLHLSSDDVFIDVGAHWGVHALTAATVHPQQVSVLAVEAHPDNFARLRQWVERNGLTGDIDVVRSAIGDRDGKARLWTSGSSMGHSIRDEGHEPSSTAVEVDVTTIDRMVAQRAHLRWRRFMLKIDVEGNELEALRGAQELFSREHVAAVIWEKSAFHGATSQSERDRALWEFLDSRGFRHFRMQDDNVGGPLLPIDDRQVMGNVFSLAPDVMPRSRYG